MIDVLAKTEDHRLLNKLHKTILTMKNKLKHANVLADVLCLLSKIPKSFGNGLNRMFQADQIPVYSSRLNPVLVSGMCWPKVGFAN